MSKKLISLILCLCMVLSCLIISGGALEGVEEPVEEIVEAPVEEVKDIENGTNGIPNENLENDAPVVQEEIKEEPEKKEERQGLAAAVDSKPGYTVFADGAIPEGAKTMVANSVDTSTLGGAIAFMNQNVTVPENAQREFYAVDISFLTENKTEVEPDGQVSITIEGFPSDAVINVLHLKEKTAEPEPAEEIIDQPEVKVEGQPKLDSAEAPAAAAALSEEPAVAVAPSEEQTEEAPAEQAEEVKDAAPAAEFEYEILPVYNNNGVVTFLSDSFSTFLYSIDRAVMPKLGASNAKGIIHFEVYIWDHNKFVAGGSGQTSTIVAGLNMNLKSYLDNTSPADPSRIPLGVATTGADGKVTFTLNSTQLNNLITGYVIDVDPDSNDIGTYYDSKQGKTLETHFDWDWFVKEEGTGAGLTGVRVMTNKTGIKESTHNANHVALITDSAKQNGFEFTFKCYVVPAVVVMFDSDGGNYTPATQKFKPVNSLPGQQPVNKATKPANPTKPGMTFKGWYLVQPDGSLAKNTFNFSTEITSSITLKAVYTANPYKITYDPNGGKLAGSSTQAYNVNTDVTLQAAPTRTGYTFAGWKLAKAVNNWSATTYSASQHIGTGKYGNLTLVAQWTPLYKYALTFDKNCTDTVSGMPENKASADWETSNSKTYTWTEVPTRTGYTFTGWAETPTGTGSTNKSTTITGKAGATASKTLYALWAENQVTINYVAVGGGTVTPTSETPKAVTGTVNGSEAQPNPGYKFVGWYSDEACTQKLTEEETYVPSKNADGIFESATYYGKFEEMLGELTITKSGASAVDTNQSFIFHVESTSLTNTDHAPITMDVVVTGNGSTTIKDLPLGSYKVTEDEGWSWRYTADGQKTATLDEDGESVAVTISNSRDKQSWFSGSAVAVNTEAGRQS